MGLSELLSLVEIGVTILVGYYLSHWVSVRDSQTRALKDYYIDMLKQIKAYVDDFWDKLFRGELNAREISDWYGKHQESLTCFDEGLRLALPIHKRSLEDVVNDIHEAVTGAEYFNDHFRDRKYQLNNEERVKLSKLRNLVDKSFNEYLVQINNSRQFKYYEIVWQGIVLDYSYWKGNKKDGWSLLVPRFLTGIKYLVGIFIVLFIIFKSCELYKNLPVEVVTPSLEHQELQKMNAILHDTIVVRTVTDTKNVEKTQKSDKNVKKSR